MGMICKWIYYVSHLARIRCFYFLIGTWVFLNLFLIKQPIKIWTEEVSHTWHKNVMLVDLVWWVDFRYLDNTWQTSMRKYHHPKPQRQKMPTPTQKLAAFHTLAFGPCYSSHLNVILIHDNLLKNQILIFIIMFSQTWKSVEEVD